MAVGLMSRGATEAARRSGNTIPNASARPSPSTPPTEAATADIATASARTGAQRELLTPEREIVQERTSEWPRASDVELALARAPHYRIQRRRASPVVQQRCANPRTSIPEMRYQNACRSD